MIHSIVTGKTTAEQTQAAMAAPVPQETPQPQTPEAPNVPHFLELYTDVGKPYKKKRALAWYFFGASLLVVSLVSYFSHTTTSSVPWWFVPILLCFVGLFAIKKLFSTQAFRSDAVSASLGLPDSWSVQKNVSARNGKILDYVVDAPHLCRFIIGVKPFTGPGLKLVRKGLIRRTDVLIKPNGKPLESAVVDDLLESAFQENARQAVLWLPYAKVRTQRTFSMSGGNLLVVQGGERILRSALLRSHKDMAAGQQIST